MDSSSCTDVGGTTSTTESSSSQSPVILTKIPTSPPPPEHHQQQQHKNHQLYRVGSGGSVVLDSENGVEAESRKLPSSQYKGVVPQPNGRWGAQIYEKHQRVWLGTFNEEEEAAKAYDIAAQRFRGRDAITNFKPLSETGHDQEDEDDIIEAAFLNSHSKAEIVDMLRKHTYKDELQQSKRNYKNNNGGGGSNINSDFKRNNYRGAFMGGAEDMNGLMVKEFEHLFDKAVTPSDVGKLNRLVIPKQHAEKHFPLQIGSNCKGVLLNFEDNGGKVWRFRYSYWNSSQSYVLTKGWSRFVKEKNLKAGDTVTFLRSTTTRTGQDHKQLYIDWKTRGSSGTSSTITSNISTTSNSMMMNRVVYPVKSVMITSSHPVQQPVQMVRLFGVNIFNFNNSPVSTTAAAHEVVNCSKGKKRGLELSVELCCKKQCLAEAL